MTSLLDSVRGKVKEMAVEQLKGIQKPSCELSQLGLKNVTRQHVTMASTLSIKNPFDHDLPIVTVTYKILSDKRELGNGEINDAVVKGNDVTKLDLPTTVQYGFLWNIVKDIGSDWDIDYTIEVGVQVQLPIVGKFTIPLHHSGTIKLPTFADMF